MTIFRIDTKKLAEDMKKAKLDAEVEKLAKKVEENMKFFKSWSDRMEKERKTVLNIVPSCKNCVRDLYRELDTKIKDKSVDSGQKANLKVLLKSCNDMWIKLDGIQKAFR